jgi:hypothetical protein
MAMLDAAKLLDVWERGLQQPLQGKVFGLLEAALPKFDRGDLLGLSIGARDAFLLDLRAGLFGPVIEIVTACPDCGERLEAELDVTALRLPPAARLPDGETLSAAGCELRIRLPSVGDLLALPGGLDEAAVRRFLIERCVRDACCAEGASFNPCALPDEALHAAARRMAEIDPQADINLAFECLRCRIGFEHVFDIASFLVKEVHTWAQRMLRDIHALAWAYGWSEAGILELSPVRRQIYLDMIRP